MDQPILEDVLRNAQSDDVDVRGRGIQSLWIMVQKDSALREVALPIFRAALVQPTDGWTVSNALRGVQKLAGEAEFHAAAMEIANYSEAKIAARVVQMVSDLSFVDELIELMRCRPDSDIQISAMRTLGRMHAPSALDPIVANLLNTQLRAHAIESLGDLGDPRAIPHLEPLLNDGAEAWQDDNHAPMLYVRDLAQTAILKLRGAPALPAAPVATHSSIPAAAPPPIPVAVAVPSTVTIPYQPQKPGFRMQNFLPYVPLTFALIQIPWFLVVFFIIIVFHEDLQKNHAASRLLEFVTMLPGLIGLAVGLFVLTRWPATLAPRICLIVGMLGCALPQFSLGYELLH